MLIHPQIDPVAIAIGPLAVRWYGLMYLVGFGMAFLLARSRIKQGKSGNISFAVFDDLFFFCVLGVVLGGRLGVLRAMLYIARKYQIRWLAITDFIAPLIPPALAAGRIGNFINGELWGRITDVPWGMVFRGAGPLPRHPSQLYQFALEGVLLFVILWLYSAKPRPTGAVSAMFLIGYGVLRFAAEFFREPDDFLGLLAFNLSMGQWLSLPMILAGIAMLAWAGRKV